MLARVVPEFVRDLVLRVWQQPRQILRPVDDRTRSSAPTVGRSSGCSIPSAISEFDGSPLSLAVDGPPASQSAVVAAERRLRPVQVRKPAEPGRPIPSREGQILVWRQARCWPVTAPSQLGGSVPTDLSLPHSWSVRPPPTHTCRLCSSPEKRPMGTSRAH